jgi:tetratricopeptide (TPR) repeat protein
MSHKVGAPFRIVLRKSSFPLIVETRYPALVTQQPRPRCRALLSSVALTTWPAQTRTQKRWARRYVQVLLLATSLLVSCISPHLSRAEVADSGALPQESSTGRLRISQTNNLRFRCDQLSAEADRAYRQGALTTALNLYERAEELGDLFNLKDRVGPLLYWIGRCNFGLNRLDDAREAYIKGRAVLKELQNGTTYHETEYLIYIISDLGTVYLNMGEYAEARKTAIEGLALSESIGASAPASARSVAKHGIAVAWATLGNAATNNGEYQASLSYLYRSLDLFGRLSLEDSIYRDEIAERLTDIGEAHRVSGDHVNALHYFTRTLAISQKEGTKRSVQRVLVSLGILYLDQGDYAIATRCLQASLETAKELGDIASQVNCIANLGFAKLRQGDHNGALKDFERALSTSSGKEAQRGTVPIYEGLAAVYAAQQRYEPALELFDKALDIVVRVGDQARQAEILWWKGEVFHRQTRYEAALGLAENAYSISNKLGLVNISRLALTLKRQGSLRERGISTRIAITFTRDRNNRAHAG